MKADPKDEQVGLEATCRFSVQRILLAQAKYDEELDRLCDQFSTTREQVQPMLDRMLQEGRSPSSEVY